MTATSCRITRLACTFATSISTAPTPRGRWASSCFLTRTVREAPIWRRCRSLPAEATRGARLVPPTRLEVVRANGAAIEDGHSIGPVVVLNDAVTAPAERPCCRILSFGLTCGVTLSSAMPRAYHARPPEDSVARQGSGRGTAVGDKRPGYTQCPQGEDHGYEGGPGTRRGSP